MDPIIARYAEQRVPRYTSYPTAPHFGVAKSDVDHRSWLSALNPVDPISLYLHVPFCKQICWYCACNMKLAASDEPVLAYAENLKTEIALLSDALPAKFTARHIHWGGGTPTSMPMPALQSVMDTLRAHFQVAPDAEIAFELDPRTFAAEMADGLATLGATRASLGVQEFDAQVQETVNRVQPFEVVSDTVQRLRGAGIKAISFDLMYGLPHQSTQSISHTIELALSLQPDRIALFGYAHVPWMAKNQRLIPEQALPDANERFEQAELAADALVAAGYIRIGLDHFALPEDAMSKALHTGKLSRNFQGYTTDCATTLLGLGATSISALPQAYVQNITETGAWTRAVQAGKLPTAKSLMLSKDDLIRRAIIERLMCDLKIDLGAIAELHGRDRFTFLPDLARCQEFVDAGLASISGMTLTVTEQGRPALRVIASIFDEKLGSATSAPRHAAAI